MPEGNYKISDISIKIGTTRANEMMDIQFQVVPNQITYLGTLQINGTKERIKLGGLPVIQPGFEYEADVINQAAEAEETFRTNFPLITEPVEQKLMDVGSRTRIGF